MPVPCKMSNIQEPMWPHMCEHICTHTCAHWRAICCLYVCGSIFFFLRISCTVTLRLFWTKKVTFWLLIYQEGWSDKEKKTEHASWSTHCFLRRGPHAHKAAVQQRTPVLTSVDGRTPWAKDQEWLAGRHRTSTFQTHFLPATMLQRNKGCECHFKVLLSFNRLLKAKALKNNDLLHPQIL